MGFAKTLLERLFVFTVLGLMVGLGAFTYVLGPSPNVVLVVSTVTLAGFGATLAYWILFRRARVEA